jgi:deoxyribodipyrimidine photolyase-related protein
MEVIGLVFPNQLFEDSPLFATCNTVYLIEEYLFFKQYNFHKRKLAFHRASMKCYERYLQTKNIEVVYVEAQEKIADIRKLLPYIESIGTKEIHYIETVDYLLEKRLGSARKKLGLNLTQITSPQFINTHTEIKQYFEGRKRLFQTDFYKQQRLTRNILLDKEAKPLGNKWTFDDENRLKYPKGKKVPKTEFKTPNAYHIEAMHYVEKHFPGNLGNLDYQYPYPISFEESKVWLQEFLEQRFSEFGAYEDAIVKNESFLHHSLLTPMLNSGLLNPNFVLAQAIDYAEKKAIPINSVEGFVRQILGWREFIRAVYELKGTEERTKNYWNFHTKIPASFYTGTTGILPIDETIKKVLETGYCHHIERLMVLGNFMLLCEFNPDEVYRWFMELFIDAYDWVMVPNVYGMSQFADGGLMATKPYISGSNYLLKMSDYPKGDWQATWDALFWRFMHTHRSFFLQNPRLGMLVRTFDKLSQEKQTAHLTLAEKYLKNLSLPPKDV